MTAAAFFSVAAAVFLLGTSREARVIEVLSFAAAVVGSIVTAKIRRQAVGRGTLVGYFTFWALAVFITLCWILVAATGATSAA